jgi:hypothetical protein
MANQFIELTENAGSTGPRQRLFNLNNIASIRPWLEYKTWGQDRKELGTILVTVNGDLYYVNEKYEEVKEILEKTY